MKWHLNGYVNNRSTSTRFVFWDDCSVFSVWKSSSWLYFWTSQLVILLRSRGRGVGRLDPQNPVSPTNLLSNYSCLMFAWNEVLGVLKRCPQPTWMCEVVAVKFISFSGGIFLGVLCSSTYTLSKWAIGLRVLNRMLRRPSTRFSERDEHLKHAESMSWWCAFSTALFIAHRSTHFAERA